MTVVSGQVHDHAGQGTPGVFVSAVRVGGRRFSVVPSTYTDLSGRWWLDLSAGQWNVRETGVASYDLTVGNAPVSTVTGEQAQATQTAPDPTEDDIARLMERRKTAREFSPRDDRDVNAPPSETRPLVESPVTRNEDELPVTGDVAGLLRELRGE